MEHKSWTFDTPNLPPREPHFPKRKPVPPARTLTLSRSSSASNVTSIEPSDEHESPLSSFRDSNPNLKPLLSHQENELPEERPLSLDSTTIRRPLSVRRYHTSKPITPMTPPYQKQPFWKYHILELGSDLYLSTNPTPGHLLCRNAPSLHVQLQYPGTNPNGVNGFRMIFRDDIDNSVFMTITSRDGEFLVDGIKKYIFDNGEIVSDEQVIAQHMMMKKINMKPILAENYTPVKYRDSTSSWTLGSVIKYKTNSTRLKDKRFIYFQASDNSAHTMALFRPHESRLKKRLISTISRAKNATPTTYHEPNEYIVDHQSYYTAGDGVSIANPNDDCPNKDKLGWITMFEDDAFREIGTWDVVLGLTLALGLARTVEEKLSV